MILILMIKGGNDVIFTMMIISWAGWPLCNQDSNDNDEHCLLSYRVWVDMSDEIFHSDNAYKCLVKSPKHID